MMKKIAQRLLALILFFNETSHAQFNTVWTADYQHTTSNNYSNESRKVVADAAGNVYVLADVTSDTDPLGNITNSTFHYTVISKYSSTGTLLNTKNLNVINHIASGFDNKGAFGLELDASGNLYIGYISYDSITNFDVSIAKFNSNLVRLWVRKFNSVNSDAGVDMGITSAGVAYAIVKSISGANTLYHIIRANAQLTNDSAAFTFAANTDVLNAIWVKGNFVYVTGYRTVSGFKAALTAKVNGLQGTLKWQKTFNGGSVSGDDYGRDITVADNGYVYVTGTSDQGSPTGNDVLIVKYQSSNGARIWKSYLDFNNTNTDEGVMISTPDTNFVYVGSTSFENVFLDQVETGLGTSVGRVAYLPVPVAPYWYLNGATIADLKISTYNNFYITGNALATDSSNRLFSTSYLVKFVLDPTSSKGSFKIDSEMQVEGDYIKSFAGVSIAFDYSKDDIYWLTDVIATYDNHEQEKVELHDIDMPSVIRKGSSGNKEKINLSELSIDPNPSDNIITVSSSEKITKIELYDLNGKMLKAILGNSEKVKINIADIINGIYISKITSESGNVIERKIIKN